MPGKVTITLSRLSSNCFCLFVLLSLLSMFLYWLIYSEIVLVYEFRPISQEQDYCFSFFSIENWCLDSNLKIRGHSLHKVVHYTKSFITQSRLFLKVVHYTKSFITQSRLFLKVVHYTKSFITQSRLFLKVVHYTKSFITQSRSLHKVIHYWSINASWTVSIEISFYFYRNRFCFLFNFCLFCLFCLCLFALFCFFIF